MNLETLPISLPASELSQKEGEVLSDADRTNNIINCDTGSMPSYREPLATEESVISEPSSASSSWLNLIQNKMKINDNPHQPAPPPIIPTVPIINLNEQSPDPSMMSPSNHALQSLLSSVNNMAFNPYPIYSPFNNNMPNTSLLNGFSFPPTAYTTTTATATTTTTNNNSAVNKTNPNIINTKPAALQPQNSNNNNTNNNNNSNVCVRSITVKFLTMYYNTLHSNPDNLKRFYHLNAEIDRSDFPEFQSKPMDTNSNYPFHKLSALKNVLFVDIEKILYQQSINNSILIRVNGTMKFPQHIIKAFEQIFFIYKSKEGFWLIQNDIFWILDANYDSNCNVDAVGKENRMNNDGSTNINGAIHNNNNNNNINNNNNVVKTYKNIMTEPSECVDMDRKESHSVNGNMVNKRMVNKFYHDSSYQRYDNNLAIFIRPIPNNITHSKLCGILRTNLIKQCNSNGRNIDICIDYIDVNYHKQFAFVYFGNQETLNVALEMNELHINGQQSQIQRKRSHNGPRKFFPKKRKQII